MFSASLAQPGSPRMLGGPLHGTVPGGCGKWGLGSQHPPVLGGKAPGASGPDAGSLPLVPSGVSSEGSGRRERRRPRAVLGGTSPFVPLKEEISVCITGHIAARAQGQRGSLLLSGGGTVLSDTLFRSFWGRR